MNKISTNKIKSATPFLLWFRRYLPQALQARVRPYLDQPYQLALNILDCCNPTQPIAVGNIAQDASVTRETARQVLLALKEGGMLFAVSPTKGWQPLEIESLSSEAIAGLESDRLELALWVDHVHHV
ncbi:hypothetical protein ACKFKF_27575 [Phormidesmis sp. 146-12]